MWRALLMARQQAFSETSSNCCACLPAHLQPSLEADHANEPQQPHAEGRRQGQPSLDVKLHSNT